MKKSRRYLLFSVLATLVIVMSIPGCIKVNPGGKQQSSTLAVDAVLCTSVDADAKPFTPSNTFYVNTPVIYVSCKLNSVAANTQVMVKITYLEGEDTARINTSMFNSTQSGEGNQYIAFAVKPPPGGFPQGDYQTKVYANGQEQVSIPFKVQNLKAQAAWPTIDKFTSTPDSISLGQSTTLSWSIRDATRITLQPEIGTIAVGDAVGTRAVTPSVTTTYILTVINDAGATARELTVRVGPAVTGAPDLIVTDFWLEGLMIYYKIKNAGTLDSVPGYTYLWVNNKMPPLGSSSFVDVLKPQQEKTMVFSSYQWPFAVQSGVSTYTPFILGPRECYIDPTTMSFTVKVCADGKDEVKESNESNNCLTKIWGYLMDYNLCSYVNLATWKNSSGEMPTFGAEGSTSGAYIKLGDGGMEVVPEQVPQGWAQGYFGFFYVDQDSGRTQVCYIKVPPKCKFIANVGLSGSAAGSDGVTFKLGIKDMSDTLNFLPGKTMTTPGVYENWVIDLKEYEGQRVQFVLRVEAGKTATNDFAIWKEARVAQQD
ncbi:MAG: hypothetical protein NT082_00390 [Chloroflexi bacterium]|nr:hypothetical protein [Chloroflexota bacterium]